MTDRVWMRHANPWSGWTRLVTAPFLFLGLWSPFWIGWWALLPLAGLGIWVWLNPRLFPPPVDRTSWITRGVFGERVWINRGPVPIPPGHVRAAHMLTGLQMVGMVVVIYGLGTEDLAAAGMGFAFAVLAKLWFVDRMVWLFEIMSERHPPYRRWLDPDVEIMSVTADGGRDARVQNQRNLG